MTCSDDCPSTPCGVCGGTASTCGCSSACACSTNISPYYNQAQGCQEEHNNVVIQNNYQTNICTAMSFNMPACNASIGVVFSDLFKITVGTYIWHPTYGYLKVVGFDVASCTVTLENECQNGNAAIGTAVPACTCFVVVDNPVGIEDPCTTAATQHGSLIVCHNGIMQPLDATYAGQIPVSIDAGNEVQFQNVDLNILTCTSLTADLTLIPGNVGPYVFNLDDTTGIVAGDIIQVGNSGHRFLVNTVPSGIQLTATIITAVPVAFETFVSGTPVCLSSCCDQLEYVVSGIEYTLSHPCTWDLTSRMKLFSQEAAHARSGAVVVGAPGNGIDSGDATLTIQNTSCKAMLVHLAMEHEILFYWDDYVAAAEVKMGFYGYLGTSIAAIGTAPAPAMPYPTLFDVPSYHYLGVGFFGLADWPYQSYRQFNHRNISIPAGNELKLAGYTRMSFQASTDAAVRFKVNDGQPRVYLRAIAFAY